MEQPPKTFKDLGVVDPLCETRDTLGYDAPTPMQEKAIPAALNGRDLLCLAEPDSGTTVAFVLPILQALMDNPQPLHSLILVPTSELVLEVSQAFETLGAAIPVRCAVLIEGNDLSTQQTALNNEPHIIIATQQCMVQHLQATRGASLYNLKYLVFNEADNLIDFDSGFILERILGLLPSTRRRTYLFSATMSSKVHVLQRAVLSNPVKVREPTEQAASQSYISTPANQKDIYLVHILKQHSGERGILYTQKRSTAQKVAGMLQRLGFHALPIHGHMSNSAKLAALAQFRAGSWDFLVVTGASVQGLVLPPVDFALNYDLPDGARDYEHRVGCARAGGDGTVVSFVTQYDVEVWIRITDGIFEEVGELEINKDEAMLSAERVRMAQGAAEGSQSLT